MDALYEGPAASLIEALFKEEMTLQSVRPEDSRIANTLTLITGEQIKIISGHPVNRDFVAFEAIRDKKTVRMVVRYDMIARVEFYFEKGEPLDWSYDPQPLRVGFYLDPERQPKRAARKGAKKSAKKR